MKSKLSVTFKNYLIATFGCLLYSAGVILFFDKGNIASGGVSGLSIIVSSIIDTVPTGMWVFIFNIPIMIAGAWKLGFKILIPTFYCIGMSSLFMNLLEFVPTITEDIILCAIGGAALVASGIGIVFRAGATTGGTDIIVKLIRLRYPHLSTGVIFLFVDGAICALSGFVFKNADVALYAVVAVFIQMYVLNTVLYGSDEARIIYIISDRDEDIAKRLLLEIDIGATYLRGNGAYTGKDKKVLMCAMKMRLLPQARHIVKSEDENAFMIVTKATSVFGEGFKSYSEDDL